jgi:branched-subunit amino acid transport protein AzlD
VDFHIIFPILVFHLRGSEPQIRGRFGSVVPFNIFLCCVLYVMIDNDGCKHQHRIVVQLSIFFCWLHVNILIAISKSG